MTHSIALWVADQTSAGDRARIDAGDRQNHTLLANGELCWGVLNDSSAPVPPGSCRNPA